MVFKKLVFSDIKTNFIFFCFLILNFTLGLAGFVGLDSFKVGIQKAIQSNAKEYLSADLAISARRLLTEPEVQLAQKELQRASIKAEESRVVEMYTMIHTSLGSRLIQLKLVDDLYPFYGKLKLLKQGVFSYGRKKEINSTSKAWVYPELLTQFNLKLGETVKIGNLSFTLDDVIVEDSTQALRLTALAPKIYIGINWLQALGLLQQGSTLSESRLYRISELSAYEANNKANELKKTLFEKYEDPAVQVQSPAEAQEESGRMMGYLNDYLGLVSLVGFFMAMIGSTYLYRSFLNSRVKAVAIMNALGLSFRRALGIYIAQLLLAALISALVSVLFAAIAVPAIQQILSDLTHLKVDAVFQWQSIVLALVVSLLGVIFSCLPYLVSLQRISTWQLLQESSRMSLPLRSWDFIYFLPLLGLFYGLSLYESNSLKIGSLFFAGLLLSFLLVYGFSHLFLMLIRKIKLGSLSVTLKQALLLISRNTSQSVPVLLALALAALLINLIPQLKTGLLNEFSLSKEIKVPGLFLIDIQDEQLEELKQLVMHEGLAFSSISPMVRARILSVNQQPFEKNTNGSTSFKTREEETEARFRNRGFNLSYRDHLSSAEKVVAGQFFSGPWQEGKGKLPELSIEKNFATRLGFKLGDQLKFDVQGLEIEGVITSFRSVKWNSFQPNFFVLFQPGVLDEAPKSWLASLPQMEDSIKNSIQEKMSKKFFNISVIDIKSVTQRILGMIGQMSWAIQFMSLISLVAGLFVIFSISKEQSQRRKWDLYLMTVLGASPQQLVRQTMYETFFLGLFASVIGVILSFIMAYILSYYIFDALFVPNIWWPLISVGVVTFFTLLISVSLTHRQSY